MFRLFDSLIAALRPRSRAVVFLLGAALVAGVGLLDWVTGPEIALSIGYLLPVGIVAAVAPRAVWLAVGVLAAGTWLAADRLAGARYTMGWVPYWNSSVRLATFLIVAFLIQGLREALDHERELSGTDALTGLLNWRGFSQRAEEEIHRADRAGRPLSLVYIDLDAFKQVNDSMGHGAGDELLRAIAAELRASVRVSDTVARLGGDEFAVLLPEAGPAQAAAAASKVLERTRNVGGALGVGATAGVLTLTAPVSVATMISEADRLMYTAKGDGKGRFASLVWSGGHR